MRNYQANIFEAVWNGKDDSFSHAGLAVYRQNLLMNAERALSISYPTVVELVGEEFFSMLARTFVSQEKLVEGDWGMWGKTFPDWLRKLENLSLFPFIADSARLDWLCHLAEREQSHINPVGCPQPDVDLSQLHIHYCAGTQLLDSIYPIVDIWMAHQTKNPDERQQCLTQAKHKLSQGSGQKALIWRPAWKALVREVKASESEWLALTIEGLSISDALDRVNPQFLFDDWLYQSTGEGLVTGFY